MNPEQIKAASGLLAALKGIMSMIEEGKLVRSIRDDASPTFIMDQLPLVISLKSAAYAIQRAEDVGL